MKRAEEKRESAIKAEIDGRSQRLASRFALSPILD